MSLRRSARIAIDQPHCVILDAGSAESKRRASASPNILDRLSKRSKSSAQIELSPASPSTVKLATPLLSTPKPRSELDHNPVGRVPNTASTPAACCGGLGTSQTKSLVAIENASPPPPTRPADPNASNATLVTPDGTQATTYTRDSLDASPSRVGPYAPPCPSSTSASLLSQACSHLISADPKMAPLIQKHKCHMFSNAGLAEEVDPFRSLTSGIIGQQVSSAAAKSIKNKFIALFNEDPLHLKFPTPTMVAATDILRLRSAGLSQRKAEYIQGLAEKFTTGELSTDLLLQASDEEVMSKLIAVRGLGKWSVEMFACFGLKRMDVFSTGDLGVQRGMAAFMGKDVSKLRARGGGKWKYMSENDMLEASQKFRPYRSVFMWYMWRAEDIDISAVDGTVA
jgi:DNA-3-methyladenine glycosylase II